MRLGTFTSARFPLPQPALPRSWSSGLLIVNVWLEYSPTPHPEEWQGLGSKALGLRPFQRNSHSKCLVLPGLGSSSTPHSSLDLGGTGCPASR